MGEIVTKEDYWQIILNDPSKIGQITTDDEKFNKVADFTYTVVQNTLLTTEDEDYLKKYEEMIDISGEGLTPFQRKVNILYMLSGKNYIPLNLVRRGLINLGVSAFDVEYIKEENKLVIHTDRVSDETTKRVSDLLQSIHSTLPQFIEVVQYNHNMEISWREINKYAECVTIDDMLAVNPDYKKDLTSDGEWVYPLPNLTSARQIFTRANIRRITIDLPKATNLQNYVAWSYTLEYVAGEFPAATSAPYMFESQPNLTEAYMKMPAVTRLDNCFPDAKLNKESVLMIIEHIPAFTSGSHLFTIGIHIDHQHDDEVLEAIANAEAKGWTMTVRWNGTPTAQAATTYGLRKPPIYAKVAELERPDGTTERVLDWGHYVTNPEDYQEFSSLEEAYNYFNLEMPQTEE